MIEFQHDHEHMAALLELMVVTNMTADAQTIAMRALDCLIAHELVVAGGIWLDQSDDLVGLARRELDPAAVLPEIRGLAADHLHAHWAVGSATVAMVIAELMQRPFTFTAHAYDIWRDRLLLPEKLRAAAAVVTCTDYSRRHLAATYGVDPAKLHVVYHGVDLERFEAAGRARRQQDSGAPDSHSISQILRVICNILDQKRQELYCISKDADAVAVEYRTIDGKVANDEYSVPMLYDQWVRMYKRRAHPQAGEQPVT